MKDIFLSNLIFIIIGLLFLAIGVSIGVFKWYWLISGYNTASKEEKANVDIEQVGKHIAIMSYIVVALNIIAIILGFFIEVPVGLFMILIVAIVIGYAIYIQRFDHNKRSKAETIGILIVVAITCLVVIVPIFYMGYKRNDVNIKNVETMSEKVSININGMYGTTINVENIKDIDLVDNLPKIIFKSNGFGTGKILKGNFKGEEDSALRLYVENSKEGPFIKITLDKSQVYINYNDEKETLELYNKLNEVENKINKRIY